MLVKKGHLCTTFSVTNLKNVKNTHIYLVCTVFSQCGNATFTEQSEYFLHFTSGTSVLKL